MDVFDLNEALLQDYQAFARSFTRIRANDLREQVEELYESGRFWPEPLLSINPSYEKGQTVGGLADEKLLTQETARVFSIDGYPITLYRHQAEAVAKAKARQSFVVTTGTGSGKSLCFFIPIIDAAIRARAGGGGSRTRARRRCRRDGADRTSVRGSGVRLPAARSRIGDVELRHDVLSLRNKIPRL